MTLSEYLQTIGTEQNSGHVAYIEECIAKGWTAKQMRARFTQSRDGMDWQAKHGKPAYRAANKAAAVLFTSVIDFLNEQIAGVSA